MTRPTDQAQASDFAALVALSLFIGTLLIWARIAG
jgi:hypothetical protein